MLPLASLAQEMVDAREGTEYGKLTLGISSSVLSLYNIHFCHCQRWARWTIGLIQYTISYVLI